MSLTPQLVAELVRQRLGWEDGSNSARIIFLIPEALKAFGRKVAADPLMRNLLLTDKTTSVLPIVGNKVDLTDGFNDYHFLLEYLDYGQIYHEDSEHPLQKLSPNQAAMHAYLKSPFIYYWLEGKYLYVSEGHTGEIAFAVPSYPTTLDELPDSEESEKMFIDKLIEMLPEVGGSDYAQDGEK